MGKAKHKSGPSGRAEGGESGEGGWVFGTGGAPGDSPFAALAQWASADGGAEGATEEAPADSGDIPPGWDLPAHRQTLYVSCERKQRAGRPTTVIEGFAGSEDALEALGKSLKQRCGVGGATKEGVVLIQGDHRNAVVDWLTAAGFKVKRRGG
jgi:translation initiation factor 1